MTAMIVIITGAVIVAAIAAVSGKKHPDAEIASNYRQYFAGHLK